MFAELEARMNEHPPISVPTVQLHGAQDGAALADAVKIRRSHSPMDTADGLSPRQDTSFPANARWRW